ncbi:MAG: hypothetical protein JWL95_3304 [Gemmatimonadetes bacterium]|nr:hypothetical protein [Gemmatimonadota bacterium]
MAARTLLIGALVCCLATSCSDSTAPAGMVEVTVSPDTIRLSASGDAMIWYVRRNPGSSQLRLYGERIDLQSEVAPGDWRLVGDTPDPYVQFALRDAETPTAAGDVAGLWTVSVSPGRYRLRYGYRFAQADGMASGDHRTVDSNVFVVIPR